LSPWLREKYSSALAGGRALHELVQPPETTHGAAAARVEPSSVRCVWIAVKAPVHA